MSYGQSDNNNDFGNTGRRGQGDFNSTQGSTGFGDSNLDSSLDNTSAERHGQSNINTGGYNNSSTTDPNPAGYGSATSNTGAGAYGQGRDTSDTYGQGRDTSNTFGRDRDTSGDSFGNSERQGSDTGAFGGTRGGDTAAGYGSSDKTGLGGAGATGQYGSETGGGYGSGTSGGYDNKDRETYGSSGTRSTGAGGDSYGSSGTDNFGSTNTGAGAGGYGGTTGSGGDTYGSGTGTGAGQNAKPSMTDKIRGGAEKVAGKMTKNPDLVEKGQDRQTGEFGSGTGRY
ncbi:hypothetical protein BDZ94DRAFT_1254064 [Collybia nuda]|uniref:Uncharacterized protein n=1 Tax=Collybia nuda TaxID=64659 RepID=A0A9P6CKE0_9AGAR|nr:hypothetical protein BDZ94DRAFT_1254064 [Collybia nuda]